MTKEQIIASWDLAQDLAAQAESSGEMAGITMAIAMVALQVNRHRGIAFRTGKEVGVEESTLKLVLDARLTSTLVSMNADKLRDDLKNALETFALMEARCRG